jgi:hypothetical protein
MQDKSQEATDVESESQFQEDESFYQSENNEYAPVRDRPKVVIPFAKWTVWLRNQNFHHNYIIIKNEISFYIFLAYTLCFLKDNRS